MVVEVELNALMDDISWQKARFACFVHAFLVEQVSLRKLLKREFQFVLNCEIAVLNAVSEELVQKSLNASRSSNKTLFGPWWVETWQMRVWNISVALKWILMYSPGFCKSFAFGKQLCWRTLFWCRIIQPWTVAINLFNELRDLVFIYIPDRDIPFPREWFWSGSV